jgi:aminoglycoside phosphotransferase (APT) family kinase protein
MPKMHKGEIETNIELVRRLLVAQFPQWSKLPITPVVSSGTDNAMYRLGEDMAVRLPRIHWAVERVEKEQRWLPQLAPLLPLAVPILLARGKPGEGYPHEWSIYRWLEGEHPSWGLLNDPIQFASDLAHFILALQKIDTAGGPYPGGHNAWRGVPLLARDPSTRKAIADLSGKVDVTAVTVAWDKDLNAAQWNARLSGFMEISRRAIFLSQMASSVL